MLKSLQRPKRGAQSRSSYQPLSRAPAPQSAKRPTGTPATFTRVWNTPRIAGSGTAPLRSVHRSSSSRTASACQGLRNRAWWLGFGMGMRSEGAIYREAVETAGGDACAPVATVAVRRCAVGRPSSLASVRRRVRPEMCPVPGSKVQRSIQHAREVRVDHRPPVSDPREPVRDHKAGDLALGLPVRGDAVEGRHGFLHRSVVHRSDPERAIRPDFAVVHAIGVWARRQD